MNKIKDSVVKLYICRKAILLYLFSASIIASLLFLFFLGGIGPAEHSEPATDYVKCYKPFADSILSGNGVLLKNGLEVCATPGYPIFVAFVSLIANFLNFDEVRLIVFFNIIISALAVCFFFLLVDSLFGRKTSLISSFLWLSYPFNLWFLKNPNTEIIFIFMLFSGIWLFLSSLNKKKFSFLFFVGAWFGLIALIRPIAFLLPLVLVVFLLARKEPLIKGSIFLICGALIPMIVWFLILFNLTGQFILFNSSGSAALTDGLTYALKPGSGGDQSAVPAEVMTLMEKVRDAHLVSLSQVIGFLLSELLNNHLAVIELFALKAIRAWYATSQMWWEGKILAVQLVYLLTSLFGIVYVLRRNKAKMKEVLLLLAIILYFWVMTITALSILRYMVPAMAFVIVFSALAVGFFYDKFFKKIICKFLCH